MAKAVRGFQSRRTKEEMSAPLFRPIVSMPKRTIVFALRPIRGLSVGRFVPWTIKHCLYDAPATLKTQLVSQSRKMPSQEEHYVSWNEMGS
jgi:hypothetical protein